MKFATWTFRLAGLYGLLVLIPMLFLEGTIATMAPPAITHPEYFYGFALVGIAWQVAFLIISTDPVRYRPLMLPAALLEKAPFGIAAAVMYSQQRIPASVAGLAAVDFVWAALFAIAAARVRRSA